MAAMARSATAVQTKAEKNNKNPLTQHTRYYLICKNRGPPDILKSDWAQLVIVKSI